MSMLPPNTLGRDQEPNSGVAVGRPVLVTSKLSQFASDRSGAVAVIFGLMAIVMTVLVGSAVDMGRWLTVRSMAIKGADAAVLAGARIIQVNGTVANAKEMARKVYEENTQQLASLALIPKENETEAEAANRYGGTSANTIAFVEVTEGGAVTGFTTEGNIKVATPFLRIWGIEALNVFSEVEGDHKGDRSVAEVATGGNSENSLEISMMLDVSGSMGGDKIVDLKSAAKDLIDIVVWDNQSEYTSKIAIAPFSADIRLSNTLLAAVTNPSAPSTRSGPNSTTFRRNPCVVERVGAERYTAAGPGVGKYIEYMYVKSSTTSCSTPSSSSVEPLSNNKTFLKDKITNLALGGGTAGHLGTAWAWYMLSPDWASVLPAASQPTPYNTLNTQKIAILMTDGEFNRRYTNFGIVTGTTNQPAGSTNNPASPTQATALCAGMKAAGITVYTVGFDLGGNQTAINTLNTCATSASHAYNADSGEQLKQAFRDIALKLTSLYLSK